MKKTGDVVFNIKTTYVKNKEIKIVETFSYIGIFTVEGFRFLLGTYPAMSCPVLVESVTGAIVLIEHEIKGRGIGEIERYLIHKVENEGISFPAYINKLRLLWKRKLERLY